MLDGVIFDLDGTLADTLGVCIEAFQNAIEIHAGNRPTPAEVVELFGPTEEGVLRAAVGSDWELAVETFLTEYERLHASVPAPFPGIQSVMDRLAGAGVPAAVVTGKGPRSTRISLEVLGLEGVFEFVEAGSIDGVIKAEKITRIADRWGIPAKSVAYVGDHPHDTREAHRAGVYAVAAAWSPHADVEALHNSDPDEFFDSVTAFETWIEASVGVG